MEAFNHRLSFGLNKRWSHSARSAILARLLHQFRASQLHYLATGVGAQSVPVDCVHWRKDLIRAAQCAWCGSCSLPLLQEEGPNRYQHHLSVSPSNYTNRLRHIQNTDWIITPRRPLLRHTRGWKRRNWRNAVLIEYRARFVCFWQQ